MHVEGRRTEEQRASGHHVCPWWRPWFVVSSFPMRLFVFTQLFNFLTVLIPLLRAAIWLPGIHYKKGCFSTSFGHIPLSIIPSTL